MQAMHRARRVIQVDNLVLSRHEEEIAREREGNAIAQLLIPRYKAKRPNKSSDRNTDAVATMTSTRTS